MSPLTTVWRVVGFGFAAGGTTGFGVAGLGRGGLDATGGFDSVFCLDATTGPGFGAGRDETGGNGVVTGFLVGMLLAMLCRAQFRCLAGLSAHAST